MTRGKFWKWIFLVLIVFSFAFFMQKRAAGLFKGIVIKEINKIINTNAELDNVDLNLLKGLVGFSGLRVKNPAGFSQENFLEIKQGYVDIDLFLLLSKKNLYIQRIFLAKPNIAIEINKDSVSNTSLIFKKSASSKGSPADGDPNILPLPSGERVGVRGNKPRLAIDKVNIKNGIFKLTNYKVNMEGATALFDKINVSIEDLKAAQIPNERPTAVTCFARLPAEDLTGEIKLAGKGAFLSNAIDFDMNFEAKNISLVYFVPFYINTAPVFTRRGRLDLNSAGKCRKNQLYAVQRVNISDLELVANPANLPNNAVFGLSAVTVMDFFVNSQGKLNFDFKITGMISDPQFHIAEALRKALVKSIGDAIVDRLSRLPGKILEKVQETGKIDDAGKEMLKDIFQKILGPDKRGGQ